MNFTLKRASDICTEDVLNKEINISTIEDLKSVLKEYEHDDDFGNALIVDFDSNEITIYDYYVE